MHFTVCSCLWFVCCCSFVRTGNTKGCSCSCCCWWCDSYLFHMHWSVVRQAVREAFHSTTTSTVAFKVITKLGKWHKATTKRQPGSFSFSPPPPSSAPSTTATSSFTSSLFTSSLLWLRNFCWLPQIVLQLLTHVQKLCAKCGGGGLFKFSRFHCAVSLLPSSNGNVDGAGVGDWCCCQAFRPIQFRRHVVG